MDTMKYINLSAMAYVDFEVSDKGLSINDIISRNRQGLDLAKPELAALNDSTTALRSYTLLTYQPNTIAWVGRWRSI